MRLLCSDEDMAEGGRDSSGAQGIFLPSKKPNLKSGHILARVKNKNKNAQGQLVEDGSLICRSCEKKVVARSGNTSNLRDYHSAVQCMPGKLTLSSGA